MHAPAPGRRLAVVTVTYNSADVLTGFLDSLEAGLAGIANWQVVVADNDSADGSADIAEAHPIRATVVRTGRNDGYAAGINAAAAHVTADTDILILNPDIRLQPGSVRRLAEALADPQVGIAVPQILNEDGAIARSIRREPSLVTTWVDALLGYRIGARAGLGEEVSDPVLDRDGGPVDWATGAALLISAEARRIVGDWDETYFLYSEEVDYFRRARDAGFIVLYVPQARFVHIGGAYHANARLSALMTSNRIRYFRRCHGAAATALFRLAILVQSGLRYVRGPGDRAAFHAALTTDATSYERRPAYRGSRRLAGEMSGSPTV